jgi:hypothetical protein
MAKDYLTKKQKELIKELDDITSVLRLDYQNIDEYEKEARTPYLQAAKDKIIRGQVIVWYTLVDEFLNMELCHYFYGKKQSFIKLWKTKKFQHFNYHILEELYLLQKLRFLKSIKKVPKNISENIERINYLRNGIAHSFFPENLKKSKPVYKGKDIFSLEGLKTLGDDVDKIVNYFLKLQSSDDINNEVEAGLCISPNSLAAFNK